jgi:hypothetical protein
LHNIVPIELPTVNVIFSPESVGKKKTAIDKNAIKTVGMLEGMN